MEYLKAFVLEGTSYEVSILWENDEPLFRATEIAKVLGIVNIRSSTATFDTSQKVVHTMDTPGGVQDVVFLTERGLYRLLLLSRKPTARRFQEWVFDVLTEIRKTGKYELEQALHAKEEEKQAAIETALVAKAREHEDLLRQNTHQTLIAAFRKKPVVYFGRIRAQDNKVLVKIGSTDDLEVRVPGLLKEFGGMQLFHVMQCSQHRSFERFMQNHHMVLPMVYRESIFEGRKSNGEVFLMTEEEIKRTLDIAKRNLYKFLYTATLQQFEELQHMRGEDGNEDVPVAPRAMVEMAIQAGVAQPPIVIADERRYTQARGPKIQRYSADGRQLLCTYAGYADAARDPDVPGGPVAVSLKRAIADASVYKGFRWAELARELPDDHVQTLAPTNEAVAPLQKGYVVMLSLDKTEIVDVFCDQKAAAENRQFKSLAAISKAIKCQTKSGGHYFQMWDDVPDELREAWLRDHTLPTKRAHVNGKGVRQIDPATGACVREFASIGDVLKEFKVGRATLQRAIEHDLLCKGIRWHWL
jgi:prophage antirepressor-like protein